MRAFVIQEYAHPSKISLSKDAPEPNPTGDEVLVEIFSAGLNYFDVSSMFVQSLLAFSLPYALNRRFFSPRASTRSSHRGRSRWAQSSRGESRRTRPFPRAARSSPATGSSAQCKARMRTSS